MRTSLYGLCVLFVCAFGCSTPSPGPTDISIIDSTSKSADAKEVVAKVVPKSLTPTEIFARHQQRTYHLFALDMPTSLTTDALSHTPCSVTVSSKDKTQERRLIFDDMKRLTKVIMTTHTPKRKTKSYTSTIELEYNPKGYPVKINIQNSNVLTYMYKDDVLNEFNAFKVDGVDLKPAIVSRAGFDSVNQTITFTASKGIDATHDEANTSIYTYDKEGRVISHKEFERGDESKRWWRYFSEDPKGRIIKVEARIKGQTERKSNHTLYGSTLMQTTKFNQYYANGPLEPVEDRTYTYKDGKLLSAKTVKFGTEEVIDTVVYQYVCK